MILITFELRLIVWLVRCFCEQLWSATVLNSTRPKLVLLALTENHFLPFVRFSVVGAVSAVVHLGAFYIQADLLAIEHNIAALGSFLLAAANGYALNHFWTFRMTETWTLGGLLGYVVVNIAGLLVNMAALNLTLYFFDPPMKWYAQLPGIPVAAIVNFLLTRFVVYRKK